MRWVKSLAPPCDPAPESPKPEPPKPDDLSFAGWPTLDYRAILPASAVLSSPPPPPHPEVVN